MGPWECRQADRYTHTDTHTHWQTQTDFIICPMLYAIAMGQKIIWCSFFAHTVRLCSAGETMWVSTSVICTVLVLDVFGWTTLIAAEQSQTLALVNIEDGEVILVATVKMSRYHAFRTWLYHVGFCYFCVEILLLVSILTYLSSSACQYASVYQISSKSNHPWRSYDVMSIFMITAMQLQIYFRLLF